MMKESLSDASDTADHDLSHKSSDVSSFNQPKKLKLVAIHLGAGSSTDDDKQRDIAKKICEQVMLQDSAACVRSNRTCSSAKCALFTSSVDEGQLYHNLSTAEDAVVRLIELMENNGSLNCGFGSNLTMDGQVECDASLMSAKTQLWTGVGAVSGCKNPILLAKSLYDHSTIKRPLGLVQPNFLVSSGARQWMRDHCRQLLIPESHLIGSRSLSRYQKYKSNYDAAQCCSSSEVRTVATNNASPPSSDEIKLDTVGAVAVDCDYNFACAISSGGIILKHKGRIGQASVPGAGCWAQNSTAATTTGVGEYLTTNLFAKSFLDKLSIRQLSYINRTNLQDDKTIVDEALAECFNDLLSSPALNHVPPCERLAGILAVTGLNLANRHQLSTGKPDKLPLPLPLPPGEKRDLYLAYGHNTNSMCIGYMTCNDQKGQSLMSRPDVKLGSDEPLSESLIEIKTIKFTI